MTPAYRSDIDGLRAVAVLSVMLFHSGFSVFSGGYVGVDIFFVISGYLITTIIVREIANNDFSISRFYERRFRRILPALIVVIAVSLVFGALLLPPERLVDLGRSAMATAGFSSNILFYFDSGYFDGHAEGKPLLHTWSLAVEEQYYIFFPLLLLLIARVDAKHYLKWLIILGSLSFFYCIIGTNVDPSAAFYLIPTRAWELFLGSILALRVLPRPKNQYIFEIISIIGILLIAYSVFYYTPDTNFPGFAAVAPTLGSAFIIYSGSSSQPFVSKILSLRPIVFVGLISYSLYLWHWPVIVYTKIYSIKELSTEMTASMIAFIFFAAVISWRYVELPFRKKTILTSKKSLLLTSTITSLVIASIGVFFVVEDGLPQRQARNVAEKIISIDPEWEHWRACARAIRIDKNELDLCSIGKENGEISFILWGDSHAKALASGVAQSAKSQDARGLIATLGGCLPLISIVRPGEISCRDFNRFVLNRISNTPEIKVVILAARWALSTKGTRYGQESGKQVRLIDLDATNNEKQSNIVLFGQGLERTVKKLRDLGKKVVLVGPVPEIGIDVPTAYFVAANTGRDLDMIISPTIDEFRQRTREVVSEFTKLGKDQNIIIVDPASYLCNRKRCGVTFQNALLYRDDDHLSTFGSKHVSKIYNNIFDNTDSKI